MQLLLWNHFQGLQDVFAGCSLCEVFLVRNAVNVTLIMLSLGTKEAVLMFPVLSTGRHLQSCASERRLDLVYHCISLQGGDW